MSGPDFVIPLSSPAAADATRVGPKAANLAALRQAKVGFAQGFGIGRPQPIDALLKS